MQANGEWQMHSANVLEGGTVIPFGASRICLNRWSMVGTDRERERDSLHIIASVLVNTDSIQRIVLAS